LKAKIFDALKPNKVIPKNQLFLIVGFWVFLALIIWINSPFKALPQPGEVFSSMGKMWNEDGLGHELIKSMMLNVQAVVISSFLCLLLAYLSVIPFLRPVVQGLSKARFLSLVGFSFIFTLMLGGGSTLKLSMLVFGMSVFLLTSMVSIVAEIPKLEFDHARTLRMPEWKVVWEVVIRGTLDKALDAIRQNAAIGWMMLTMVEGIVRSEGGIGAMLLNEQKHFAISSIIAIQIIILFIGLIQDYVLGLIRRLVCPYAHLTLERK